MRLDPDRVLTQGLRDQLATWSTRPLYLVVASAPALAVLRDETRRVERPPVRRPLGDRRDGPAPVAPDDRPDLAARYVLASSNPFHDWSMQQRYAPRASFNPSVVAPHAQAAHRVQALIKQAKLDGIV